MQSAAENWYWLPDVQYANRDEISGASSHEAGVRFQLVAPLCANAGSNRSLQSQRRGSCRYRVEFVVSNARSERFPLRGGEREGRVSFVHVHRTAGRVLDAR